jgi:lysophospholipase L1-like esterase
MSKSWKAFGGLAAAALTAVSLSASAAPAHGSQTWVAAWASSQYAPEPNNTLPAADLQDATLRQVVRLTLGGRRLRIRIANTAGTAPLHVTAAHVARPGPPGSDRIDPRTDRAVTFGGRPDVTVPAGADYLSDPVDLALPALASLAVSLHFDQAPAGQTGHPGARATAYLLHGDHVADAELPGARKTDHWFQLAAVETEGPPARAAIVTLGDSITDGAATGTDRNERWPDVLAERLQANPATRRFSVVNQGIGGNRLLNDGAGPNVLARLDRDVLAQPGVRYVILLEGINDLGTSTRTAPIPPEAHAALVRNMIGAYRQIIARAHAKGIKVIGATVLPDGGSKYYHPDAANEADRQAVNAFIRSGAFDGVVDFDKAVRDPKAPDHILAKYDSGDGLHPGPVGYRAMGEAVPLGLFK